MTETMEHDLHAEALAELAEFDRSHPRREVIISGFPVDPKTPVGRVMLRNVDLSPSEFRKAMTNALAEQANEARYKRIERREAIPATYGFVKSPTRFQKWQFRRINKTIATLTKDKQWADKPNKKRAIANARLKLLRLRMELMGKL